VRKLTKLLLPIGLLFWAACVVSAQNEAQKLNAQLSELYQKADLNAAVPVAEQIVAIERKSSPVSDRNLANALENLAQVKLERVKRSMAELRLQDINPESAVGVVKLLRQDASETEAHLREAIELSKGAGSDPSQPVNLKANLAWLLYNYVPAGSDQKLGFDKDSRDRLEMYQRAVYSKRFEEARTLYADSVRLAKGLGGSMSLATEFKFAEFESAMGNFEAALPLYAKIVADAENLLGRRDPQLLLPYEAYLKLLVATKQEDLAFDVLSKIVAVSGKTAEYPKTLLNVTYRADKVFAPVNSNRVEEDARTNKDQAELSGRGIVARTAAAGGDVAGATLAVSTSGKNFYDTLASKGIKTRRVLVRVSVDEFGGVTVAEGLSNEKVLNETAETAVKQWKFRPLLIDGKSSKFSGYAEVTILSN
jgi:hypothetical protein